MHVSPFCRQGRLLIEACALICAEHALDHLSHPIVSEPPSAPLAAAYATRIGRLTVAESRLAGGLVAVKAAGALTNVRVACIGGVGRRLPPLLFWLEADLPAGPGPSMGGEPELGSHPSAVLDGPMASLPAHAAGGCSVSVGGRRSRAASPGQSDVPAPKKPMHVS